MRKFYVWTSDSKLHKIIAKDIVGTENFIYFRDEQGVILHMFPVAHILGTMDQKYSE